MRAPILDRTTRGLAKRCAVLFVALLAIAFDTQAETPASASLRFEDVRQDGLFAHLYLPAGSGPFPIILAVGGSEGGFITGDAFGRMFPQEGVAVLGIAYFGVPGLPPAIDRIPLEYFIRAIDYIERHPALDANRIAIVGGSKGAELALLLASLDARIHAVCAIVPSHVVWQSARLANRPSPSWTFRGSPMPFVPYKGSLMPDSKRIADLFELSLRNERAVAAATIKVENINGPILLISASEDEIWPSKVMAEAIVVRLAHHDFAHAHRHLTYRTGHGFSRDLAPEVNREIVQFVRASLLTPR